MYSSSQLVPYVTVDAVDDVVVVVVVVTVSDNSNPLLRFNPLPDPFATPNPEIVAKRTTRKHCPGSGSFWSANKT